MKHSTRRAIISLASFILAASLTIIALPEVYPSNHPVFKKSAYYLVEQVSEHSYAVMLVNVTMAPLICVIAIPSAKKHILLDVKAKSISKDYAIIKGLETKFIFACKEKVII